MGVPVAAGRRGGAGVQIAGRCRGPDSGAVPGSYTQPTHQLPVATVRLMRDSVKLGVVSHHASKDVIRRAVLDEVDNYVFNLVLREGQSLRQPRRREHLAGLLQTELREQPLDGGIARTLYVDVQRDAGQEECSMNEHGHLATKPKEV